MLDLSGLSGVTDYEPEELVLVAHAGTPVAEIEGLLRQKNQQMAFEPPDLGPLYRHRHRNARPSAASSPATSPVHASYPGRAPRATASWALQGVTGRGELIKAGARVVKNVTGYDVTKLIAGSHGTLVALTEVTVKVLPMPEKTRTVLVFGLDAMTRAARRPGPGACRAPTKSPAPLILPAGRGGTYRRSPYVQKCRRQRSRHCRVEGPRLPRPPRVPRPFATMLGEPWRRRGTAQHEFRDACGAKSAMPRRSSPATWCGASPCHPHPAVARCWPN